MASLTKTFDFDASPSGDLGSYTSEGGTWTLVQSNPAQADESGPAGEGGVGKCRRTGFPTASEVRNNISTLKWHGTWEDLGVPAGAIVSDVKLNFRYRRAAAVFTAGPEEIGPSEYRSGAGVLRATFSGIINTGISTPWTGVTGTQRSVTTDAASNTAIEFWITSKQGAQNTGTNYHEFDTVAIEVIYTVLSTTQFVAAA